MNDPSKSTTVVKLSIKEILHEAFLFPWHKRQHFARLLIIPMTLMILIGLLGSYWLEGQDSTSREVLIFSFVSLLPHFLVFTFFAVSCHRSILIGEHAVSRFGVPGWSMRETRFFLWLVAIYTIAYLAMLFSSILVGVFLAIIRSVVNEPMTNMMTAMDLPVYFYIPGVFALAPFAYVVGRLCLLLPGTAVDLRPRLKVVWSQSKGNGWRLAVLAGGIPAVFLILKILPWIILGWLVGETSREFRFELGIFSIVGSGLAELLYFALATVEVAVLSIAFRELFEWKVGPKHEMQPV